MAIIKLTLNTNRIIEVSNFVLVFQQVSHQWSWEVEVTDRLVVVHTGDPIMKL